MDILIYISSILIVLTSIIYLFIDVKYRNLTFVVLVLNSILLLLYHSRLLLTLLVISSYFLVEFFIKLNPKEKKNLSHIDKKEKYTIVILVICMTVMLSLLVFNNLNLIETIQVLKDKYEMKFIFESVIIFFVMFVWLFKFKGIKKWK